MGKLETELRDETDLACYTAGDVRKAAGLSYRQLNEWDAKGAVGSSRETTEGWRKFTVREVFALGVCSEVRTRFGVSLASLAELKNFMLDGANDHFQSARRAVQDSGLSVWLLSDLKRVFEVEAAASPSLKNCLAQCDASAGLIVVNLDAVVKRVLSGLKIRAKAKAGRLADVSSQPRSHDQRGKLGAKLRSIHGKSSNLTVLRVLKNSGRIDPQGAVAQEKHPSVTGALPASASVRPITSRAKRPIRGSKPPSGASKERT